jgi:hypothetical protein
MLKHLLRSIVIAFLCADPVLAAEHGTMPSVLAIAVINDCSAPSSVVATAVSEASSVWAPAGVSLHWMTASQLPYRSSRSDWLIVRCVGTSLAPAAARPVPDEIPIAAIRFVDAKPTNTVLVSFRNANVLLERDATESRILGERFKSLKEKRLGRMLGRAIAHEIGHFLNQSGAHTDRGLMKAAHSVSDLTGRSRLPFKIERPEVMEIAAQSKLW